MNIKAIGKYFLDINMFNIPFSLVIGLTLGIFGGIITFSSFGISIWTKKFSKVRATIAEGLNNHNNKSKILGCRFLEQGHFSNCVTLTSINKKVPIYPRKMIGYYILWAAKWGTNHYCGMHRSGVICIQKKFIQLFSFKL